MSFSISAWEWHRTWSELCDHGRQRRISEMTWYLLGSLLYNQKAHFFFLELGFLSCKRGDWTRCSLKSSPALTIFCIYFFPFTLYCLTFTIRCQHYHVLIVVEGASSVQQHDFVTVGEVYNLCISILVFKVKHLSHRVVTSSYITSNERMKPKCWEQ